MPYVTAEAIEAARQIDLLTYLRTQEPGELVHVSGNTYCTREHDSLKISNGKWHWFSRGIGGRNALDYLVKVKEMSFPDAVSLLTGTPPQSYTAPKEPVISKERRLLLPDVDTNCDTVKQYLDGRGIHATVVDYKYTKHSDTVKERYAAQMNSYVMAVKQIFGIGDVDCYILSIADGKLLKL